MGQNILPSDHMVRFHEDEAQLVSLVGAYLSSALGSGEAVVVIAVPEHCRSFLAAIGDFGINVGAALHDQRLLVLDAEETLARFLVEDRPDRERFENTVGALLRDAAASGRPVRAYGEMVTVLAAAGNVHAALELEGLWNRLGRQTPFALLCGYPAACLSDQHLSEAFEQVCRLHTDVIEGAPQIVEAETSQRFLASEFAPELARGFTATTMAAWGYEETSDAILAVSELATNAVRYAGGDLTVGLTRSGGGVRLEVSDTCPTPPKLRMPSDSDTGGRGLRILEALAKAWGHNRRGSGKIVWAMLPEPGPRR